MEATIATKRCNLCNEIKPITEFYTRAGRSDLYTKCKPCHSVYRKEKSLKRREIDTKLGVTEKECRGCHKVKPLQDFYPFVGGVYGRAAQCKKCSCESKRKYDDRPRKTDRRHGYIAEDKSEKQCSTCKVIKPISEFYPNKSRPNGFTSSCKECCYRTRVGRKLKVQYDELFINQMGACSICGTVPKKGERRLHVDHDHQTGVVRGLLCHDCNLLLGNAKDNPAILKNAIKYLKAAERVEREKGVQSPREGK